MLVGLDVGSIRILVGLVLGADLCLLGMSAVLELMSLDVGLISPPMLALLFHDSSWLVELLTLPDGNPHRNLPLWIASASLPDAAGVIHAVAALPPSVLAPISRRHSAETG
jgi:hypothetical protein